MIGAIIFFLVGFVYGLLSKMKEKPSVKLTEAMVIGTCGLILWLLIFVVSGMGLAK